MKESDLVAQDCNLSTHTLESEEGGSWVQGQLGLHSETMSKKGRKEGKKERKRQWTCTEVMKLEKVRYEFEDTGHEYIDKSLKA
jgi:hypothetical protein